MRSVTLDLEQIRRDKRRALQQGKRHLFRYLERLEQRAERNAGTGERLDRELEKVGA